MLSVECLNPIKILCSYTRDTLWVEEPHVAMLAALLLAALAVHQRGHLLYYGARIFFRCNLNNIFFSSVEVVGMENLPKEGPVILTGNHNNQFVDALILLTNCHREISFMIAKKSWDRPLVGFLARAFHCIPVARPQDSSFRGDGSLVLAVGSQTARGVDSHFSTQLQAGSMLELKGRELPLKVKQVLSDTELMLETAVSAGTTALGESYKIMPKVDQSEMYSTVYRGLKMGKCLGIFPEGGSHDRTDLLPLKAGVAVIALEAFSKHHLNVPIVPVGLNYFGGHRFGGRVVVEFGAPIRIPEDMHAQHEVDRRGATDALLKHVATGMRSVIVPTPNYHTLQQIYMVRRLWTREGMKLSPQQTMDLNRRFAVGTHRILKLVNRQESSAPPVTDEPMTPTTRQLIDSQPLLNAEELGAFQEMQADLEEYMHTLKRLGVRDHHVPQIGWWTFGDLIGRSMYLLVTMALGAIPHVMFNLPIMIVVSRLAATEQRKSLQSSTVKLAARDVVMSYKVIYALIFVPLLFLFYSLLLWRLTSWSNTSRVLVLLILPFFAFLGMKASEQGVRAYADMVPLLRRLLLPAVRREQDALPSRRAELQRKLNRLLVVFRLPFFFVLFIMVFRVEFFFFLGCCKHL
ncbi:unnamed protein product [Polarella glacialis]|uniref:Phospholipid/glycerol acyltransferase domain-containing protein n=1 Tax=Polarella glacialis TaxID=89957 RepID=A0A813LT83_POLGL|nr:unnamed protein product [Polarella glacialis]